MRTRTDGRTDGHADTNKSLICQSSKFNITKIKYLKVSQQKFETSQQVCVNITAKIFAAEISSEGGV